MLVAVGTRHACQRTRHGLLWMQDSLALVLDTVVLVLFMLLLIFETLEAVLVMAIAVGARLTPDGALHARSCALQACVGGRFYRC